MNLKIAVALIIFGMLCAGTLMAQSVPNLQLTGVDRSGVQIEQYLQDGPVMINFWSLSCAPCKREMKFLDQFSAEYDSLGFEVISINVDTPKSLGRVRSYVRSNDFAFPVFLDPRQEIFRKFGGRVLPYSIFVNPDGSIRTKHVGYAPGDEKGYETTIRAMLGIQAE